MCLNDFPFSPDSASAGASSRLFSSRLASPFSGRLPSQNLDDGAFRNPILPGGHDPWVVRHGADYFYCGSEAGAIFVGKSSTLTGVGADLRIVFAPPRGRMYSQEVWAPELHFLDGRAYIYFSADDGRNENHRLWVLRAKSDDPQGEYELMGALDTGGRWAIDGSILKVKNQPFLVWSGWAGARNIAQLLYIAPLVNPWTLGGRPIPISRPEFRWETCGRPLVNEGPTALKNGDKTFLIYSASGSWTDDYCLGRLDLIGDNPLDPKSWRKHPTPVFSRTKTVFGPGHASFVNDGNRDWIIYHAAQHKGSGWKRDVRIQPFGWNGDGTPHFGTPLAPGSPIG